MKPENGDRIIIKNVPEDYHYRDLYQTEGRYEGVVDVSMKEYQTPGHVSFLTGYTPHLDGNHFEVSGCVNGCKVSDLTFIERKPANFWRFKHGIRCAHSVETYQRDVNYWELDFAVLGVTP